LRDIWGTLGFFEKNELLLITPSVREITLPDKLLVILNRSG